MSSAWEESPHEKEQRRTDILKGFATDLDSNACQIRKMNGVYFTSPWWKGDNESLLSVGGHLKPDPIT